MITETFKQVKTALLLLLLLTVITGLIYPVTITALAQLLFPYQANGSLIVQDGRKLGSELIGQAFTDPKYFWGRPSATQPFPYNALSSSGSNLGPLNPDFVTSVKARIANLKIYHAQNNNLPVDLVTTSGSGLDPEISPFAAFFQLSRVAQLRGMSEIQIQKLIQNSTKNRYFGIFGEPRVNVLLLNITLDNFNKTRVDKE